MAATTPTGRAISISPRSRSSLMTPTDFAPAVAQSPIVLRRSSRSCHHIEPGVAHGEL
jgi:hypothetical protein